MPLTPEDVVEKRFNPTRVREGYAQDEVDDFLDEVVAELRRLNAENAELRGQLNQCQSRVAELTRSGAAGAPSETTGTTGTAGTTGTTGTSEATGSAPAPTRAPSLDKAPESEPEPAPEPVREPEPQPALVAAAAAQPAGDDAAARAAGVIALAQRLHDEYVREGESQRDALVLAAQEQAERVVADAEERRDRTLGELEGRRVALEQTITQLHGRESTYREQLEHFIASQLEDLRRVARVVPDDALPR
ncbi:DivIVA domain-containing protein [Kineococcus sp. LSe6-4]|uniref:Cell wall synthesis protein Wag31 n=1 Tax=Kineococcus halophytocola TaxID=3234027 RepID=A0ABV4H0X6_9ACTN